MHFVIEVHIFINIIFSLSQNCVYNFYNVTWQVCKKRNAIHLDYCITEL